MQREIESRTNTQLNDKGDLLNRLEIYAANLQNFTALNARFQCRNCARARRPSFDWKFQLHELSESSEADYIYNTEGEDIPGRWI